MNAIISLYTTYRVCAPHLVSQSAVDKHRHVALLLQTVPLLATLLNKLVSVPIVLLPTDKQIPAHWASLNETIYCLLWSHASLQ